MCYTPLTLRNPRKNPIAGLDPEKLTVPCGHCPQCRMTRTNDWYVRSYYEWLEAKKYGGFTQSITLTYASEHLPTVPCRLTDGSTRLFPCFSRRHFQLLMKRLNKWFTSLGVRYSYIISSEYGDEKHRPHYHILFNVKSDLLRPSEFVDVVREEWNYGHIYTTDINDGVITDIRGIRYASKYAVKDIYQDKWYQFQLEKIVKFTRTGRLTSCYKNFLKNRPFHQVSQGYGLYALTPTSDGYLCGTLDSLMYGYLTIPDYSGIFRRYRLPLYLERKLFYRSETRIIGYDSDKSCYRYSTSYVLNELGIQMKERRLQSAVESLKTRFSRIQTYHFPLDYLIKVHDEFLRLFPQSTIEDYDLVNYINSQFKWSYVPHLTSYALYTSKILSSYEVVSSSPLDIPVFTVDDLVANYFSLNHFDRTRHSLEDFSHYDGLQFNDLVVERKSMYSHFHHVYREVQFLVDKLYEYISQHEAEEEARKEAIAVRLKILKRRFRQKFNH